MIFKILWTSLNIQKAAPIPPMLNYSNVHNFLNSPPILIKSLSKFMVCKALYFETQSALKLRSPLKVTTLSERLLRTLSTAIRN